MSTSAGQPPLKLLALDGGGIRGLSELLIIQAVMHRLMTEENKKREKDGGAPLSTPPKPCDYFDLIGGTSTGGIIALMLGRLRMDVDTAIRHYDYLAKYVFSDTKRWGDGQFKATKLEKAIKSVVKDVTGDAESPLLGGNETGCRTFVCAMNALNMNANIPVLFRTYSSHEIHSDCKIWEAARATSAAPTFFKRIEIGRNQPFIDGGLGRNNPSRVVLDEANALFGGRHIGCLVSIGTGQAGIISINKPGAFQQIVSTDVIDALRGIATDCEATHQAMLILFSNSPDTYFRLNVEQGMQGIDFFEWERLSNVEAHTTQYMKRKEVEEKVGLLVNAMRAPKAHLTIQQLISPMPSVESIQRAQERKLCPLPVSLFTGRNDILNKMRTYFDSNGKFQHVFVLYGLGGSGKSQLAFEFVRESQVAKRFSDIFYIDATNEQTLQTDLMAIVPGNIERSVDTSLRWLARQCDESWLLLFDNADDIKLNLKKFFPPCRFGNILVTTRNPDVRFHAAGKDADTNVTGMDVEDARNLLLQLSRAEESDQNKVSAELIVQELHYFVLAVSQAGAFIYCRRLSLIQYRELYRRERDNLLQNKEVQGEDEYGLAVYATWRLSYDKLNPPARSFLHICSMLHHEGISEEMFEKAAFCEEQMDDSELQREVMQLLNQLGKQDSDWNSWVFRTTVVKDLLSYSLIEYDDRNRTYSIHPLVQHWSDATMKINRLMVQKCILGIIGLSISWTFRDEDYKYRRSLLKHTTSCRASLNPKDIDPFIATRIALMYTEQGRWNDVEALDAIVMEKTKQVLGDDHPDTLASMANLASTYRKQGRLNDAEALDVVIMEKRKQLLGDDHLDTLKSMANLASTYRKQGRLNDAEALDVVVMEKRTQVLGDDHPDTIKTMANLASTYRNQGHLNSAEALEAIVMMKMKQLLGDDHPGTLASMANLASTYRNQGRLNDAEALDVVVVEKRKQVLGADHPVTLISMGNLASTYRHQGRLNNAEALEAVVMEKMKQVLGDDHPDTLMSMASLASTYRNQGRLNDAETLEAVVMEKRKWVLGDDHPDTLTSMSQLASTYRSQGHLNNAEALGLVVLEKRRQLLGDHHPHTLISMANLAHTYVNQGRLNDAEAFEEAVMDEMKYALGDDHPHTLTSMANLAATYREQGRLNEAEALEIVVMEKRRQVE